MSDLRAKAEDALLWLQQTSGPHQCKQQENVREVIESVLALVPADEGEAVTEEWLRSLGFSGDSFRMTTRKGDDDGNNVCVRLDKWDDEDPPTVWIQRYDLDGCKNIPMDHLKTRGQLRRLLSALGLNHPEKGEDQVGEYLDAGSGSFRGTTRPLQGSPPT
jgi:hypothetical protein